MGDAWDDPDWPEPSREWLKIVPQFDIHHPDITCGRQAFKSAATTETADVLAGSEVGFRVSYNGATTPEPYFYHRGPGQIYLSRAPDDDLEHYRGDGDWFKIAYSGPVGKDEWSLYRKPDVSLPKCPPVACRFTSKGLTNHPCYQFNFTIPQTTPPGKYLMRLEFIYPTPSYNYSQWFINWYVKAVLPAPLSGIILPRDSNFTPEPPPVHPDQKTNG